MMKDALTKDHVELDLILEQIFSAFEKGDAEEVYQNLDLFRARLSMHIRAEDLYLFPSILKAIRKHKKTEEIDLIPSLEIVQNSILHLHNDHNFFLRELGNAVKQLFEMRENKGQDHSEKLSALHDKIIALRQRLKFHNELEEGFAYLWAEMLNPAEIPVLKSKIQRELENLPVKFRISEKRF